MGGLIAAPICNWITSWFARSWMTCRWRADRARWMKGYEICDSIHGHRIIADAGKISDPMVKGQWSRVPGTKRRG